MLMILVTVFLPINSPYLSNVCCQHSFQFNKHLKLASYHDFYTVGHTTIYTGVYRFFLVDQVEVKLN